MIRVLLFTLALMLPALSYADSHQDVFSGKSERGYWKTEDCKKVSDASGMFLYISGELLKESDEKGKNGNKEEAAEIFRSALAFSELSANYAKSFEAFCKE